MISEGDIFIYSCSAQLISFEIESTSKEINCAEHEYMNMSPSLIALAPLQNAIPTDNVGTTNVYYKQVHLLICGTFRYRRQYGKKTKQWRPVAILESKQYNYVPHLLVQIFLKRRSVPGPVNQRHTMDVDNPRRIASNIAIVPPPPADELVKLHKSRFL